MFFTACQYFCVTVISDLLIISQLLNVCQGILLYKHTYFYLSLREGILLLHHPRNDIKDLLTSPLLKSRYKYFKQDK